MISNWPLGFLDLRVRSLLGPVRLVLFSAFLASLLYAHGDVGVDAADDQAGGVDETVAAVAVDHNDSAVTISLTTIINDIINNIIHSAMNTTIFIIINNNINTRSSTPASSS